MKILYVASIGGFFPFFKSLVRQLLDAGHTVDFAANFDVSPLSNYYKEWGCGEFEITVARSPFSKGNIKAIRQIREIVKNGSYDVVHCHTPVASICTRIACRPFKKKGLKVFYTAHGFHFFNGASLKNWLLFYPVEKICSRWTDVLITINHEDYDRAQKKLKAQKTVYVPGVGIDINKFCVSGTNLSQTRNEKRQELGIPNDAIVLISVGELSHRKNHTVVFDALHILSDPLYYYVVAGEGSLHNKLKNKVQKLHLEDNVCFLGYRTDICELLTASDIFVFPSFHEGLPVALMESMASGIMVIASDIRGINDLISNGVNGKLFAPEDAVMLAELIKSYNPESDRDERLKINKKILSQFSSENVNRIMLDLYKQ